MTHDRDAAATQMSARRSVHNPRLVISQAMKSTTTGVKNSR